MSKVFFVLTGRTSEVSQRTMDKLTYVLTTVVLLCLLPLYCELRSVKRSMNYDAVLQIKKTKSNTDDNDVPIIQTRMRKQTQQDENSIGNTASQNIKPGKLGRNIHPRETKTLILDSPSNLQHNNLLVQKHLVYPRNITELKIEEESNQNNTEYLDTSNFTKENENVEYKTPSKEIEGYETAIVDIAGSMKQNDETVGNETKVIVKREDTEDEDEEEDDDSSGDPVVMEKEEEDDTPEGEAEEEEGLEDESLSREDAEEESENVALSKSKACR